MSEELNTQKYVDFPEQLLKLCRKVITELDTRRENSKFEEHEKQLKEINRTISKLEREGISVPDELRSLKMILTNKLREKENLRNVLEALSIGLEEILKDLNRKIGKSNVGRSSKPFSIRKKRSTKPKTNKDILRQEIIFALKKLGGKAHIQQVLSEMEKQLQGKLLPGDLEIRKSGEIAWKNNACWERFNMIQDGILSKDSPRGIWELTEKYKS